MTELSNRDGYHVSQHVRNGRDGSELERDHCGFTGQEVGNLLGQGSTIYHPCLAKANTTVYPSPQQPQTPIVELTGLNKWAFTAFEYGEKWRIYRRLFHEFFNVATVERYDEEQKKAASRLLKDLSERPAGFFSHVQLATGSLALSIAYDLRVDSSENPYFHAAEAATESLQAALVPGAFPVEFLPIRAVSLLDVLSA